MNAATEEQTLLDEYIARADAATLADYTDVLEAIAKLTTNDILDEIERNALIEALNNNKKIGAGKVLIRKALTKVERDLQPQRGKGIEGGHGMYRLASDGVYKLTDGEDIRISSRLEVLAMTRTSDGNGWGRMLEWSDIDNRVHRWAIPASMTAGDGHEAIKTLLERGLYIRTGNGKNVLDYLMSVSTENRLYSTDKTGWHDGAFVTPAVVYGSDDYVFQSGGAISAAVSMKGSLPDWRDNIAAMAAGNSRLVFAISSAFAGTLLHGAGVDSGGFHFHGNSSDGKSTAQFIAASVWGNPKEYAQTWRATGNGLEAVAAVHNDSVLILDEIGQANPKEIGETAYMLANGQGKTRMTKSVTNREVMNWRLLFLSSGEYTLADMMQGEGKRSFAGQELRLANISSNAGAGMGIFENIHSANSPAQFADTLKDSINQSYGMAGDAWLTAITENPVWRNDVSEFLNTFVADVSAGAGRQAGRVARRFALVAYAGEMATEAGITGWVTGKAIAAAKKCFESWLDGFGKGNRENRQILEQVRAFVDGNPARFQSDSDIKERSVIGRVGFKKWVGETQPEIYLLASQLTELAKGYSPKQIRDALYDAGWTDSTESKPKSIAGEKTKCFKVVMPDV